MKGLHALLQTLSCVPIPTALRMSLGMLFPARSSLHKVLLLGRQFTRARPPRRPMLFQRKSERKPIVTRQKALGRVGELICLRTLSLWGTACGHQQSRSPGQPLQQQSHKGAIGSSPRHPGPTGMQ